MKQVQEQHVEVARRSAKLWRVLVAGGAALALACAGTQKPASPSPGSDHSSDGKSGDGGGASGW
ncbi:MAG: hypothetical protein QM767_11630 [Anaeromyxobacter sp.]